MLHTYSLNIHILHTFQNVFSKTAKPLSCHSRKLLLHLSLLVSKLYQVAYRMKPSNTSIPTQIILIFGGFCAVLLALFLAYERYQKQDELMAISSKYHQNIVNAYNHIIDHHKVKLNAVAALILRNEANIMAFSNGDRDLLFQLANKQYNSLKHTNGLEAITFYLADGTTFLRLHQPEKYDDKTTNPGILTSASAGYDSFSIIPNLPNTPLLSVIYPWRQGGALLGYIEVASNMMLVLDEVADLQEAGLMFMYPKRLLYDNAMPNSIMPQKKRVVQSETHVIYHTENVILSDDIIRALQNLGKDEFKLIKLNKINQLLSRIPIGASDIDTDLSIISISFPSSYLSHDLFTFILFALITFVLVAITAMIFFYVSGMFQIKVNKYQREKEKSALLGTEIHRLRSENDTLTHDIQLSKQTLEESQKRYQTLFRKTTDALLLLDGNVIIDCNQASLEMFGFQTSEEMYNVHPSQLSPSKQPDGRNSAEKANKMIQQAFDKGCHRFEWQHKKKNGDEFPVEVLLTSIPYGDKNLLYTVCRDISQRKKAEEKIHYQANYDMLTGLPNRNLLYHSLESIYATAREKNQYHALLFLDIDRFKNINDAMGHTAGDALLNACAKRIKTLIDKKDMLARFGGDEFVLLLQNLGSELTKANFSAERIAETIRQSFETPVQTDAHELEVTLSIGISIFPITDESVDDVLKNADAAMYKAKDSGRNRSTFFASSMQEDIVRRINLEKDLKQAMEKGEIYVMYQPQYDGYGDIASVEALARWKHPEFGMISPEEFISIAEESGHIGELGEHIIKTSCADISRINQTCRGNIGISINVSPKQLSIVGLLPSVTSVINHFNIPADKITLEITEHALIENIASVRQRLTELKNLGVNISLDDFGTGYSSLSYLRQLPLTELKIDRSFVMELSPENNDIHLIRTIIEIGHEFGLHVVAEGVENLYQLNYLKKLKCNYFQGYYLSKPITAERLIEQIQNQNGQQFSS